MYVPAILNKRKFRISCLLRAILLQSIVIFFLFFFTHLPVIFKDMLNYLILIALNVRCKQMKLTTYLQRQLFLL